MANSAAAQCHGKAKHRTYSIASKALKVANSDRVKSFGLHIYHCKYCQHFHIGTLLVPKRVLKAEKLKRATAGLDDEKRLDRLYG